MNNKSKTLYIYMCEFIKEHAYKLKSWISFKETNEIGPYLKRGHSRFYFSDDIALPFYFMKLFNLAINMLYCAIS